MSRSHSFVSAGERGLVFGFVGLLDEGQQAAAFVGHDLTGYVDQIVAVGLGGSQCGCDLEEFGECGREVGGVVAKDVGGPCGGVCRCE